MYRICFIAFCFIVATFQMSALYAQGSTAPPAAHQSLSGWVTGVSNGGAGTICPDSLNGSSHAEGRWISRIVHCFAGIETDASGNVTYKGLVLRAIDVVYINGLQAWIETLSAAVVVFSMVLLGYKMLLGTHQGFSRETLITAFKVGGVLIFFNNFIYIHDSLVGVTGWMGKIVAIAARNTGTSIAQICPAISAGTPNIWSEIDCIIEMVIGGFSQGLMLGIVGIIVASIFSAGLGIAVFFFGMAFLVTLMLAVMRAVFVYMNAVMSISFLFLVSPIFVPLVIFKATYEWFTKWLQLLISFPLQVMVLYLTMFLSVSAIQYTVFIGKNSLSGSISNTAPTEPTFIGYQNLKTGATSSSLPGIVTGAKPPDISRNYVNRRIDVASVDLSQSNTPVDSLLPATGKGFFPYVPRVDPNALASSAPNPDSEQVVSINVLGRDSDGHMNDLNARDNAVSTTLDDEKWQGNVMTALTMCLVVVYIIMNVFSAVPQISSDIAAQNAFGVTKPTMLGQQAVRKAAEAAKAAVKAELGDEAGAAESIKKLATEANKSR